MYKFLKWPFFGRYMVKWKNPLTTNQQKEWLTVKVDSKSGSIIYGLFGKSYTENEKATIVLGHPIGKEAKAYFLKNHYTELLRNNGYNTLIFDFNGFGESKSGNLSYFEDVIAIGNEAHKLKPNLPIGYHGISFGGAWATIAFTDPNHKFDFAIIESAGTTLEEYWINFPLAYRILKIIYFLAPRYKRKIRMVDRIKEAKNLNEILFIYSNSDELTPVVMGEKFIQNCPIPSELWTVNDAQHASIMKSKHKSAYENKIIEYFDSQI